MSPPLRNSLVVESTKLAVRLPNWVGDVCMALPTLHALHGAGWELHCFGRGWAPSLLRAEPWLTSPLPKGLRAGAKAMANSGARNALLLTNSLSSAAIARFAGLKPIGFRGDGRSLLLTKAGDRRAKDHEVEAFLSCARILDPNLPEVPAPSMSLKLDDTARDTAQQALKDAQVSTPFLVMAPLAVGTIKGERKIWPYFTEISNKLHAEGLQIVACPGPGEEDDMSKALPAATILPDLDLLAYAAVCSQATLSVANDSGPMHLAAAAGGRVLGLFGLGEPWRTAPWGGAYLGEPGNWPTMAMVEAAIKDLMDSHD